jgi:hypothetical protein
MRQGQQADYAAMQIMYFLKVGKDFNKSSYYYLTRSHTSYGKVKGKTISASGCAAMWLDHILPMDGQRTRTISTSVVQLSDKTTYCLWVEKWWCYLSKQLCNYLAGLHTAYEWVKNKTILVNSCAAIWLYYVLSKGGQGMRQFQQLVAQLSDEITYFLCAGKGWDKVSKRVVQLSD